MLLKCAKNQGTKLYQYSFWQNSELFLTFIKRNKKKTTLALGNQLNVWEMSFQGKSNNVLAVTNTVLACHKVKQPDPMNVKCKGHGP